MSLVLLRKPFWSNPRISYPIVLDSLFPVLDVSAFERLLGSCMDMMRERVKDYEEQLAKAFGSKVLTLHKTLYFISGLGHNSVLLKKVFT